MSDLHIHKKEEEFLHSEPAQLKHLTFTIVAAASTNDCIGKNGKIPWRVPADFKFFKEYTMGKVLIMGRKTFESIGDPLPGRRTIVVTRDLSWSHPGVEISSSLSEAVDLAATLSSGGEVILAGGAEIYQQALPIATKALISRIPLEVEGGDSFLPELPSREWEMTRRTPKEGFILEEWTRFNKHYNKPKYIIDKDW